MREIERAGTCPAKAGALLDERAQYRQVARERRALARWKDGTDQRVGQPRARGNTHRRAVPLRTLVPDRREELVMHRIEDRRMRDFVALRERDRDCEVRKAMHEIQAPVDRIDDPAIRRLGVARFYLAGVPG